MRILVPVSSLQSAYSKLVSAHPGIDPEQKITRTIIASCLLTQSFCNWLVKAGGSHGLVLALVCWSTGWSWPLGTQCPPFFFLLSSSSSKLFPADPDAESLWPLPNLQSSLCLIYPGKQRMFALCVLYLSKRQDSPPSGQSWECVYVKTTHLNLRVLSFTIPCVISSWHRTNALHHWFGLWLQFYMSRMECIVCVTNAF